MEQSLKQLEEEEQEQKYSAELDTALTEYTGLRKQAQGFDPVQLYKARQAIRPQVEQEVVCRLQKVYGDRYSFMMMEHSKRNTAWYLHEADEEGLVWKVTRQRSNRQKQRDDGER